MMRTQILLPTELYQRAKRAAAKREISLAELTCRALELLLDRYPEPTSEDTQYGARRRRE